MQWFTLYKQCYNITAFKQLIYLKDGRDEFYV